MSRFQEFAGGSADALDSLIRLFLTDTGATIADLADAVARADSEAIRQLAHRAGGSSAVCGAAPLAALLLALEDRATATTADDNGCRMRVVTREFAAVSVFLDTYLKELQAP